MTETTFDWEDTAPEWLHAAHTGGLPRPRRTRWQPLRVGIANLWEYDDAEFWFADGRLVLRGGNGAGKTKVLELTTLMLLRGEIAPAVLDPFGSQHRTMRFNLLPTGDGDDPRPLADAGLGYAWAEFGRVDESGAEQYFVCGLGASARAGSGSVPVTTWQFITQRRPGRDFVLREAGRAIDASALKKIDGITLPPNATAYRARLADELFGLSGESYDNLTELLKQLRKPKLGERLNPATLAASLRDALPPLATHEIGQLADGWERLERLRLAVQRAEDAATALAGFVKKGWRPWARAVLRNRADDMASATTQLDRTTADKKAAESALADTETTLRDAIARLEDAKHSYSAADTALTELIESGSYKDAVAAAGRVDALRRELRTAKDEHDGSLERHRQARKAVESATQRFVQDTEQVERARANMGEVARALLAEADPAGLSEVVQRYLPDVDISAIEGEFGSRRERFEHLQVLDNAQASAERKAERSEGKVEAAAAAVASADVDTASALEQVRAAADALDGEVRAWSVAARVGAADEHLLASWLELITDLTEVIDNEPAHGSVVAPMRAHLRARRDVIVAREQQLQADRRPVAERAETVTDELERVRASTEEVPPEPRSWTRRDRPEVSAEAGAPLWRLVNPVATTGDEVLARVEAALAAAGLLDAWVNTDGSLDFGAAELGVAADRSSCGTTSLRAVLEPVAVGGVEVAAVERVLDGFGWLDAPSPDQGGAWFAADGSWRVGALGGRAEPVGPAAYLGAAAREANRLRRIAELTAQAAELAARLYDIDTRIAAATADLAQADGEEAVLPVRAEKQLSDAVVRWADRGRALAKRTSEHAERERDHNNDLAAFARERAAFADYAATHRFGLTDLDGQAAALSQFAISLLKYRNASIALVGIEDTAARTSSHLEDQQKAEEAAVADLAAREAAVHTAQVKLNTAEAAVGASEREQLDRKRTLENDRRRYESERSRFVDMVSSERVAEAMAQQTLAGHENRRADAEANRDAAMAALWQAVDEGLSAALETDPAERRNVVAAREFTAAIRREVFESKDAPDADRAWRVCYNQLEELRQALLPQQDARVTDEDEFGLPRVEIHTGAATGFQVPPAAADTLAQQVQTQRAGYDAEQQQVLATLLGSAFIEHLKDRLDYTTRTFTRINDLLVTRPTRQGHAVRIQWPADPTDPDAAAVVDALGQGYSELSPDRQLMVRDFLTRRIESARAESSSDAATDWKEQLTRALDYRSWLKITLQYRPGATSSWVVFDAARHGAKSGGEKVVLLSQPLFAAAVVAYDAAAEHAPRVVWLDEAMSGVDSQVKSQFMGLTVDFELDIMLTAHDEWCTYPTVPAVAVYDLARARHIAGVDAMAYLWCSGTMHDIDVERLGAAPAETPELDTGLFSVDA
ncbi:TIGR02680 family protein [Nocardia fluminea]|uniref:TIGR02680 family protein n=1 Tax=Nocardia fluminea TaxID=134984 RepID=UPI00381D6B28